MKTKQELQQVTCDGFKWVYNEDGAHFFQKCLDNVWQNKFAVIRCLPEDLENGNFEFFVKHGLTNTNKAEKVK